MNQTLANILFALRHPILQVKYWIWKDCYEARCRREEFRKEWHDMHAKLDCEQVAAMPPGEYDDVKMDPPMPCEVCGGPSVQYVQDIKEAAPIRDNGIVWRTWRRDGLPHFYCLLHGRAASTKHMTPEERSISLCR